jgi:hypothetical protein
MKYSLNTIKLDIAHYRHYWRGTPKVGKTTAFRDLVIEAYGKPEFGMLISMGYEEGYKTLDNLYAQSCPTWGDFVDVVEDLVENKNENTFKILALDTVDELVEMAERKVMEIHRITKGEAISSINAALGGYGAGKKKARQLIEEQIGKLELAGYGMVYIGHTKTKDMKEKLSDEAYQMITGSLEFAYDAIFADRADFMPMFIEEVEIKDERKTASKRVIYFRGTDFVDAGSRLSGEFLPEKINLDAKEYINAITVALEKSTGKTSKEIDALRKKEEKEYSERAIAFSEKEKNKNTVDSLVGVEEFRAEVLNYAKSMSKEVSSLKKQELERKGLPLQFSQIDDMETLKKIYRVLKADD